jgi:hypothetical protein
MSDTTYITTRGRQIASIFLGALLGTLITAVPLTLVLSEGLVISNATDLLYSSILCGVCWLLGIAGFAFPIWLLIERRRKGMGWRTAAACGLILSPVWFILFTMLLADLTQENYTLAFWSGAMGFALALGAVIAAGVGCAVALVMWRYAYRRMVSPDIAETFG